MAFDARTSLQNLDPNKTARERGHYWKVTFPNLSKLASSIRIKTAELVQDEMSHDILTVNIKGILSGTDRLTAGDPVKLDWEILGTKTTWFGYVYMVETITKSSSTITKVTCMGLSYTLKNQSQRTFTDITADRVAAKVAKEHGLKADIVKHPWTFPMISQTGQSDWSMLSRLAAQCGFGFRVDGSTLIFKPKDAIFNASKSTAPYLKYIDEPSSTFIPFMTLYDFHPILAEQAPDIAGSTVNRKLSSIERDSNKDSSHSKAREHSPYTLNKPKASRFIKESPKATFEKIITDEVSVSSAHSKHILEARMEHEKFRYKATAASMGHPNLKPYSAVYLDGLPHDMSGYWTVLKVKHMFGGSRAYRVSMTLGTDTVGEQYPKSVTELGTRDVAAEILNEIAPPSTVTLEDSSYISRLGTILDPEIKAASIAAAKDVQYSTEMYNYITPDFSEVSQVFKWRVL